MLRRDGLGAQYVWINCLQRVKRCEIVRGLVSNAERGTDLEAVVETLGFGLDLLGVFQHPLIQHQSLAPLLHQHVRLGYEETPEKRPH